MEYQFKKANMRLMTISDRFPKGKAYLFSRMPEQISFNQMIDLGEALSLITGSKVVGYDVTTTQHVAAE